MKLSDFDYNLPEELIAQTPLEPRDSSRLMVLRRHADGITHERFSGIAGYLRPGDLLVFNDTRVIPARLYGSKRGTGARAEVFLLQPAAETDCWEVLVRPGKKIRAGAHIDFGSNMSCEITAHTDFGGRIARFAYSGDFAERLQEHGEVPLPPYVAEKLADSERYQTVYASNSGSVAAPTAGLHFTPELIAGLQRKGVQTAHVTLHVGIGTFRPVSAELITEHVMHSERYFIPQRTAELVLQTRQNGGRVVAVGTTSVRSLESAAAMIMQGENNEGFGETSIFIYPGYDFKVVDALLTNFHLPKSSLLMLVAAFAGYKKTMAAYQAAIDERYRFFSFGDAMLIV